MPGVREAIEEERWDDADQIYRADGERAQRLQRPAGSGDSGAEAVDRLPSSLMLSLSKHRGSALMDLLSCTPSTSSG